MATGKSRKAWIFIMPLGFSRRMFACLHYGNLTYQGVKDILRKGLDLEPLPGARETKNGVLETPLFSRPFADIVSPNLQEN